MSTSRMHKMAPLASDASLSSTWDRHADSDYDSAYKSELSNESSEQSSEPSSDLPALPTSNIRTTSPGQLTPTTCHVATMIAA